MIPENDFDEVQKWLPARRPGNDERGRPRVPTGVVQCAGCGSRLVAVKTASGLRYYRCSGAMKGDVRDAACRTLVRVPDGAFALLATMEEIMQSKKFDASSELATDRHTAVYARDGAVQPEQSSLEAQVEACVRQVAEDGAPPVGAAYVYRDRQSGAELDRLGLNRLRRAVQGGEVGVVYVNSPERLSRDPQHFMLLHREFASAGVELRFVRGFSGNNRDDRVRGGAALGVYGYDYDKVEGVPTSDEREFSFVPLVYELYLGGWSFARIAACLNEMDISTERGG